MPTQQQSPTLLVTDQSASVLRYRGTGYDHPIAYSPFGFHVPGPRRCLSGFNGQALEFLTLGYLLGNGYRHFNPALQRFFVPDDLSPFDAGGYNAYIYCAGDPQNYADPTGHGRLSRWIGKKIRGFMNRTSSSDDIAQAGAKFRAKKPLSSSLSALDNPTTSTLGGRSARAPAGASSSSVANPERVQFQLVPGDDSRVRLKRPTVEWKLVSGVDRHGEAGTRIRVQRVKRSNQEKQADDAWRRNLTRDQDAKKKAADLKRDCDELRNQSGRYS